MIVAESTNVKHSGQNVTDYMTASSLSAQSKRCHWPLGGVIFIIKYLVQQERRVFLSSPPKHCHFFPNPFFVLERKFAFDSVLMFCCLMHSGCYCSVFLFFR